METSTGVSPSPKFARSARRRYIILDNILFVDTSRIKTMSESAAHSGSSYNAASHSSRA